MTEEIDRSKSRSIVELSCEEAQKFLLKQKSYCTIDLPVYFNFDNLLSDVDQVLRGKSICRFLQNARVFDDINHVIVNNKDGRYAWRPLELIHPALYISLVNNMTKIDHWELIRNRFCDFHSNTKIKCLSLPVESLTEEKDRAEQIHYWWRTVEQKAIELSLDYEIVIHADIVDCYAAIYTHSVAWALHGKEKAKKERNNKKLIGNIIDKHIQGMRQGQSNGIPQGSALMDFIAEMVLGYADSELIKKIEGQNPHIEDYQILRYRDDYRIFVKNSWYGEYILKCLTEVMIDLGLKLSPQKINSSSEVINSSIKDDKLSWLFRRQGDKNLQKHLLIIHDHSRNHPNAGSLDSSMEDYYERLDMEEYDFPLPLIAIVVDIAYRNPRTYARAAAILSKLIDFLETKSEKQEIVKKIRKKFSQIPNTGHLEIWLQRISLPYDSNTDFNEPLCQLVLQKNKQIWNNGWISCIDLKKAIDPSKIVDRKELTNTSSQPVISIEEVELFTSAYDKY